jgi:mannose-6-phosphate isomerase-like protein (cupin superfamily)
MRAEMKKADLGSEFHTPEGCFILEVANDAGDEEMSISRARVPAQVTTEWHALRNTNGRYVIVNGHGCVELGGLPPTDVAPGDVVRIPANTPQRISNRGQEDLIFYCICTPRFQPDCYVPRAAPRDFNQESGNERQD